MFPVRDVSVPTLIISDCEVWIYALLGHHREIKMVSFNRLVWIKSAEQLNYLRDKRKKRNIDKMYKIYNQKHGHKLQISQAGFAQIHRYFVFVVRFLLFLFICFAKATFCRIAIGHEVASAMRRRCFSLKNLHKSPGRASSNRSPVNQKHQSVISYTPPPPVFPRRYTAGNLWRAAARCRLCPAL